MPISFDTVTKDQVRALVLELLRNHNTETAYNHSSGSSVRISPYRHIAWGMFYQRLIEKAGLINEHFARRGQFLIYAEEIVWEFIARGLIVPRAVRNDLKLDEPELGWSTEAIDDFSREYLVTPYDSAGYARHLAVLLPNLNSTATQAMEESIRAFNARCYASSVVMYGVAAESVLLEVFDAFVSSLEDGSQKQQMQKFADGAVLQKLRVLREKIALVAKNCVPLTKTPLKDAWEFGLSDLSNVVRQQRNNAGHPELRDNFNHGVALGFLCAAPHHLWLLTRLEEYFQQSMLRW